MGNLSLGKQIDCEVEDKSNTYYSVIITKINFLHSQRVYSGIKMINKFLLGH